MMPKQNILINDLLSFFNSKLNYVSKDKLINCINTYYSKSEIIKAKNMLYSSLTKGKSLVYEDNEDEADISITIYNCLKLNKEYLPTFVCKNLNNIPRIGSSSLKKQNTSGNSSESDLKMDQTWNENVCRKEQEEMKSKISEMNILIKDLKQGMQNYVKSAKWEIIKDVKTLKNDENNLKYASSDESFIAEKSYDENEQNSKMQINLNKEIDKTGLKDLSSCLETEHSVGVQEILENDIIIEDNWNKNIQICGVKALDQVESNFDNPSASKPVAIVTTRHEGQTIISINDGEASALEYSEDTEISYREDYITHVLEDMDAGAIDDLEDLEEKEKLTSQNTKHDLRACAPEKCPVCNISLETKRDYDLHAGKHYTMSSFDCALCNLTFTTRENLTNHFLQCVKRDRSHLKDHSCSICGSFYADHASLSKHKSLHSECRRYPCSRCSYRFFDKKGLQMHIRNQHNPMNKYFCPLCNLSFLCNSYLSIHISTHVGARPFSCNLCEHKTDTKKAMKHHLQSHGSSTPKKYKCKECKFSCLTSYALLRHRLFEHREAILCTLCDKTFRNPSSYKRHYNLHNKESNFKCKLCTYTTTLKRYLDKHMLTHQSSFMLSCSKCDVSLSSKHTIGIHLKNYCLKNNCPNTKRNERDRLQRYYKCSLCLYSTSCKPNLEKHTITHPTVTDFFCPKCCIPLSSKHTVGHHLRSYCTKNNDNVITSEF